MLMHQPGLVSSSRMYITNQVIFSHILILPSSSASLVIGINVGSEVFVIFSKFVRTSHKILPIYSQNSFILFPKFYEIFSDFQYSSSFQIFYFTNFLKIFPYFSKNFSKIVPFCRMWVSQLMTMGEYTRIFRNNLIE